MLGAGFGVQEGTWVTLSGTLGDIPPLTATGCEAEPRLPKPGEMSVFGHFAGGHRAPRAVPPPTPPRFRRSGHPPLSREGAGRRGGEERGAPGGVRNAMGLFGDPWGALPRAAPRANPSPPPGAGSREPAGTPNRERRDAPPPRSGQRRRRWGTLNRAPAVNRGPVRTGGAGRGDDDGARQRPSGPGRGRHNAPGGGLPAGGGTGAVPERRCAAAAGRGRRATGPAPLRSAPLLRSARLGSAGRSVSGRRRKTKGAAAGRWAAGRRHEEETAAVAAAAAVAARSMAAGGGGARRGLLKRKPNFTLQEIDILMSEVLKYEQLLFGAAASTVNAYEKQKIWWRITNKINAAGRNQRDIGEVKNRWRGLRRRANDKITRHRQERQAPAARPAVRVGNGNGNGNGNGSGPGPPELGPGPAPGWGPRGTAGIDPPLLGVEVVAPHGGCGGRGRGGPGRGHGGAGAGTWRDGDTEGDQDADTGDGDQDVGKRDTDVGYQDRDME